MDARFTLFQRHARYLELLKTMSVHKGDWRVGEIELVTDPERFVELEERLIKKWGAKGFPECFGHVGVLHEDAWFVVVRDPVLFPPRGGGVARTD